MLTGPAGVLLESKARPSPGSHYPIKKHLEPRASLIPQYSYHPDCTSLYPAAGLPLVELPRALQQKAEQGLFSLCDEAVLGLSEQGRETLTLLRANFGLVEEQQQTGDF